MVLPFYYPTFEVG